MDRAQGDVIKANELMNCGIFEYYFRIDQFRLWAERNKPKND